MYLWGKVLSSLSAQVVGKYTYLGVLSIEKKLFPISVLVVGLGGQINGRCYYYFEDYA